jgi:hypothetical protein
MRTVNTEPFRLARHGHVAAQNDRGVFVRVLGIGNSGIDHNEGVGKLADELATADRSDQEEAVAKHDHLDVDELIDISRIGQIGDLPRSST